MGTETNLSLRLKRVVERRDALPRRGNDVKIGATNSAVRPDNRSASAGQSGYLSEQKKNQKSSAPTPGQAFKLPAAYSNTKTTYGLDPERDRARALARQQKPEVAEDRCSIRKPVVLSGFIKNKGSSIDVDIRLTSMSMRGAGLTIDRNHPTRRMPSETPYIADFFELCIPHDKMTVQCRLIWRKGDAFGAIFESLPQISR